MSVLMQQGQQPAAVAGYGPGIRRLCHPVDPGYRG
jgi:hypothetical protein